MVRPFDYLANSRSPRETMTAHRPEDFAHHFPESGMKLLLQQSFHPRRICWPNNALNPQQELAWLWLALARLALGRLALDLQRDRQPEGRSETISCLHQTRG